MTSIRSRRAGISATLLKRRWARAGRPRVGNSSEIITDLSTSRGIGIRGFRILAGVPQKLMEVGDRPFQAVAQCGGGLPLQDLPRARNVGLPLLRIVLGQGLEFQPRARTRQTDDLLR